MWRIALIVLSAMLFYCIFSFLVPKTGRGSRIVFPVLPDPGNDFPGEKSVAEKPSGPEALYDPVKVVTIGNHSWLPIGKPLRKGAANDYAAVLAILRDFEKKHPKLAVTSWNMEKVQDQDSTGNWFLVSGLWIDHRSVDYEFVK